MSWARQYPPSPPRSRGQHCSEAANNVGETRQHTARIASQLRNIDIISLGMDE